MKISTMALFLGGALVCATGGIGLAACSSDTGTGNPTSGTDSGGTTHDGSMGTDSAPGVDAGPGVDTGTPTDSGTAAECGTTPGLHPSDGGPGSIYCPFGPDDGGAPIHCDPTQNQICCINPKVNGVFPPSTCGTVCPYDAGGSTAMQCQDSVTCSANNKGSICCAKGAVPVEVASCNYYNESPGLSQSSCEQGPSCATGEFQMCAAATDCPTGTTCTPFKVKGMQLGFCK